MSSKNLISLNSVIALRRQQILPLMISLFTSLCFFLPILVHAENDGEKNIPTASYCVIDVGPPVGQISSVKQKAQEICYKSAAEAQQFLASSTIIGTHYSQVNYQNSAWQFTTTHLPGCSDGSTYQIPDGTFQTWNDNISSAKLFTGCGQSPHYDLANYSGAVFTCGVNCSTLGAMNESATSIKWKP